MQIKWEIIGTYLLVQEAQTFLTEHKGNVQYTLAMNFALGKWITPYLGVRISAMGGALHPLWPDKEHINHFRYAASLR